MFASLPFFIIISSGLLGYCLGSIPFGLLITRYYAKQDIRNIGSGNIGATNVLRTGNKKLAAATLLLDGLKGALAVAITFCFFPPPYQLTAMSIAGACAVIGHCFPIFLKFKGGKGVATGFGVLAVLMPKIALCGVIIWLVMVKATHISSLGALSAFIAMPVFYFLIYHRDMRSTTLTWTLFALCLLIIIRHHENIKRLLQGEER